MRRATFFLTLALGLGVLVGTDTAQAAPRVPLVTSIMEGRDTESGRITLIVVGRGVAAFRTFVLHDAVGADVGPVEITLRTPTILTLRLPEGAALGPYD